MWDLYDYHDIEGLYLCYRGGMFGNYSQIKNMSEDIACLIQNLDDLDGIEEPSIKIGAKVDLKYGGTKTI